MKVYQGLEAFKRLDFGVVTSGTFDGVHLGHQKILNRLKEIAGEHNGETVVITFWPHPRIVLSKETKDLHLLSTIDEKTAHLEKQGVDHLVILPFTEKFSHMSPEEFVQEVYVDAIGTKKLVIGYDHRFGKDREGGIEYLRDNFQKFDFEVEEISRKDIENVVISSTKIRNALLEGNIKTANQYLGRFYSLKGEVVNGDKIGRTIGFPTANIHIEEAYKLIPGNGIYAAKTIWGGNTYDSMLYIGNRPTVEGTDRKIEVHLFDFDQDIYNQSIEVLLIDKIRDDEKLQNLTELRMKLENDRLKAKEILVNEIF
jgi:riboflavin kinase/FMN adenylyltransferase